MAESIDNTGQDERGLLPYPVILAAAKGDPDAVKIVVQHYDSYINNLVYAEAPRRVRKYLLWH